MLEPGSTGFFADVSLETLNLTTLGQFREGQAINLELALSLEDHLGGHLVTIRTHVPSVSSSRFLTSLRVTLRRKARFA